jgi:hypothetical protein
VPVVCLDHQGMHDIVTDQCGVKIPVTTPREVVAQLRASIIRMAEDATQWERLSRGALERAREYLWSRQDERMTALYFRAIDGKEALQPTEEPLSFDAGHGHLQPLGMAAAANTRIEATGTGP